MLCIYIVYIYDIVLQVIYIYILIYIYIHILRIQDTVYLMNLRSEGSDSKHSFHPRRVVVVASFLLFVSVGLLLIPARLPERQLFWCLLIET